MEPREAAQPDDRSGRDDRATAALSHLRNRILHPEENAAQEHRERAIPILDRNLLQRPQCTTESCIVTDDVESSELFGRACDHRFYVGLGRHVGSLEDGAPAILLALAYRRLAALNV